MAGLLRGFRLLGGSWVVVSGVMSKVTTSTTPIRVVIYDPPPL